LRLPRLIGLRGSKAWIILLGMTDAPVGLRMSDKAERIGLDLSEHHEDAYDLGAYASIVG
jgi:ammonia channel protein AmtB